MSSTLSHPVVGSGNYKPLNTGVQEIRLLIVESGGSQNIVQCALKHVSLLDQPVPEYETISYCWGSPTDPSFIELDGHVVQVPANTEAAVRRMRLVDKPRILWIDAICIDQGSLAERSEQVMLMPTIYLAGKRNLVYLGQPDDGRAKQALNSIQDVLSDMRNETNNLNQTIYDKETRAWRFSDKGFDATLDLQPLVYLFNAAWFT